MSPLRDDILVYVENPKEKVPTTNTWVKEDCKFKSRCRKSSVPLYPINKQLDIDSFSKNTIFSSTKAEIIKLLINGTNLPLYILNLVKNHQFFIQQKWKMEKHKVYIGLKTHDC